MEGLNYNDNTRTLARGMSQSDYMLRQRYVENSGYKTSFYQSISAASHPAEPYLNSSGDVRHFVQEQRKIIDNFKAQPWPMKMKMAARKAYQSNLSKYAHELNTVDTFRDFLQLFFKNLKSKWDSFTEYITIWGSIIKQIEGHFGSSVASFFTFLRWTCALNFVLSLMVLGFIVVPQFLGGHGLDVPSSVKQNGSAFSFIFDGRGYVLEYSVLFYGYYDSGQNEPYKAPPKNPRPYIGWGYRLPLAYLMVVGVIFFVSIIATLLSMAKNYKVLQRASISEQYLFAWKIFASWDYTITNRETAAATARQITVALKESLLEADKVLHKGTKWYFFLIRLFSQTAVTLILLTSCYGIYLAVEESRNQTNTETLSQTISTGFQGFYTLLKTFQVQLVIIGRNIVLPFIFKAASKLEKHHPRTELKILLIRLFLLYVSSLYVLIIALLSSTNRCNSTGSGNGNGTSQSLISLNLKRSVEGAGGNIEAKCCWETAIGQELFKLCITHFLAEVFSILANDVLRWAIVNSKFSPKFDKLIGLAEFQLAENVLRLVYGQALVWLGILFSPLLVLINFLRIVLLFYIRAIVVSVFDKPPRTMFRIASTRNFYLAILLIVTFLCIFPTGYAIVQISPSLYCGPFRGLQNMLKIVVYEINTWPVILKKTIDYTQTATIIIPGIALLFIVIFYYMTLVGALKDVNKDLKLQLHMEQKEIKERIIKEGMCGRMYNCHQTWPDRELVLAIVLPTYKNEESFFELCGQWGQTIQEQGSTPTSPVSYLKNRHKELTEMMEQKPRFSSNPTHLLPPPSHPSVQSNRSLNSFTTATPNPSPFLIVPRERSRRSSVIVREIEEDDESTLLRNMTAYTSSKKRQPYQTPPPSKRERGYGHQTPNTTESEERWTPNSTVGYVDNNIGATIRQTML